MDEIKTFESGGFVVTTQRFVWGTRVISLTDVDQAVPFVEREYKLAIALSLVGVGMLIWGGVTAKIIGLLLLVAAYGYVQWSTERVLVVNTGGEYLHIQVPTTDLLYGLSGAINEQLQQRKTAHARALAADLESLPRLG